MNVMDQIEDIYGALQGRFFGKFKGIVVSNADPQNLGRLLVRVPDVLRDQEIWASACVPYAGQKVSGKQTGFFAVPPDASHIWIEFEGGNPDFPIWVGCQWIANQTDSAEAAPDVVVLRNGAGSITMSESSGEIILEAADSTTVTIGSGGITLEGTEINFSANGSVVSISASGLDALNGAFTVT